MDEVGDAVHLDHFHGPIRRLGCHPERCPIHDGTSRPLESGGNQFRAEPRVGVMPFDSGEESRDGLPVIRLVHLGRGPPVDFARIRDLDIRISEFGGPDVVVRSDEDSSVEPRSEKPSVPEDKIDVRPVRPREPSGSPRFWSLSAESSPKRSGPLRSSPSSGISTP